MSRETLKRRARIVTLKIAVGYIDLGLGDKSEYTYIWDLSILRQYVKL